MRTFPVLSISTRLFIAILATAVITALLISAGFRLSFEKGFLGYMNELAEERVALALPRLSQAYAERQNWDFLRGSADSWFDLMRYVDDAETSALDRGVYAQADLTGVVLRLGLLDAQFQRVAGYQGIHPEMPRWPVDSNGRTVGWLVLAPFQSVADTGAQRFAHWMLKATLGASVLALFIAGLIAWWVSQRLLVPVRRIAAATHRLAAGHHDVRVDESSPDEVGVLASDFNRLARTLERNETLRKNFVADVSHELRTPVTVLRTQLEAMEDGITPVNANAITTLQKGVLRLGKLIEDLYDLTLSDAGALSYLMSEMDLGALLRDVVTSHRARVEEKGLHFELFLPDEQAMVRGDAGRLQQLFDNLLENSLRYTDSPGIIRITLTPQDIFWLVEVDDSPPGVPEHRLPQIFERFFRAEESRSRATGGAGLGLAIALNIAQAHGAGIHASSSPLNGLRVSLRLPRA